MNEPPHALRCMLFGKPLRVRKEHDDEELETVNRALVRALRGVEVAALFELTPSHDAISQARLEWQRLATMPPTYATVMAKRAALLYAAWSVPDTLHYWSRSDPELVRSLDDFVLPLVMPSFVRGMAQCADSLVVLVSVLCDMWSERDLCGLQAPARAALVARGADAESEEWQEPSA